MHIRAGRLAHEMIALSVALYVIGTVTEFAGLVLIAAAFAIIGGVGVLVTLTFLVQRSAVGWVLARGRPFTHYRGVVRREEVAE